MKYLMKLESFTESKTYIKKYENIFQDNNLKKYFSWRLQNCPLYLSYKYHRALAR